MDRWLNLTPGGIALCLALMALLLIHRHLSRPGLAGLATVWVALWFGATLASSGTELALASVMLSSVTLLTVVVLKRRQSLPSWLAVSMPSANGESEVAVQVTAHPVNGKLQVFHLSRWFEAVLIDPANPPLRDGETVYLIRWEARQAWVSRVRSHTPKPESSTRIHRRWQWSH